MENQNLKTFFEKRWADIILNINMVKGGQFYPAVILGKPNSPDIIRNCKYLNLKIIIPQYFVIQGQFHGQSFTLSQPFHI